MPSPPESQGLNQLGLRRHDCGIVVLCGGNSTRMGVNKSALLIDDATTFLERIVRQAATMTDRIVVAVGQGSRQAFERRYASSLGFENVTWVEDAVVHQGPTEGIHQGLKKLEQRQVPLAFVTSCDVPGINFDLIVSLIDLIGDFDAVTPVDGRRVYGMTAVYRTRVWTAARDNVTAGRLRVSMLARSIRSTTVNLDALKPYDSRLNAFENINTPKDYFAYLRKNDIDCTEKMKQQFNARA